MIHFLLLHQLFIGILCLVFVGNTALSVLSSLSIILLYVFLVSCDSMCFVAFPHGAMGYYAVCNCGISWSYLLFVEIKCPTSVPNGRLPYYCKALSGESCDDYTCNRGYRRNVSLVSLTCTESGNWNHNVSSLCLGLYICISWVRCGT